MNSIQELHFTGKDIGERWTQVKEDFWGDLKSETLIAVKRLLKNHNGGRNSGFSRRASLGTQYEASELS